MFQSTQLDVIELADIVALASNPIQGILALLRWQRQFCPLDSIDFKLSASLIQDKISNNRSLLRKLSHYAMSVSLIERTLLIAELPLWLVPLLELPVEGSYASIASYKRGSNAIALGIDGDHEFKQSMKRYCLEANVPESSSITAIDKLQTSSDGDQNFADIPMELSRESCDSSFVSYSDSSVWKMQQSFYEERGAGVWERGEVPSQISSNTFVANAYVATILKFIEKILSMWKNQHYQAGKETHENSRDLTSDKRSASIAEENECSNHQTDCRSRIRVAVVEIGAGHGLLSLLMARKFQQILQPVTAPSSSASLSSSASSSVPRDRLNCMNEVTLQPIENTEIDVTVIATDFHSGVFEGLVLLPWIRTLCESGVLDFAVCAATGERSEEFDPGTAPRIKGPKGDAALKLLHSGRRSDEHEWDLLVVVANYAFDSFPTDFIACVRDTSGKAEAEHRLYEVGVGPKYSQKIREEGNMSVQHSCESKSEKKRIQSKRRKCREHFMARPIGIGDAVEGLPGSILTALRCSDHTHGSKVYALPTAGIGILQRLKDAFPVTPQCYSRHPLIESKSDVQLMVEPVMMIVGDCVVAEDSQLWQTAEFEQLALDPVSGPVPIPWFDPPLISPQPTVCAVPISVTAMDHIFAEVFGNDSDVDRLHSQGALQLTRTQRPRSRQSYLRSSTPQCGSSFSVLVYSNTDADPPQAECFIDDQCESGGTDMEGNCRKAELNINPTEPHFGPHDYSALRELFLSDRPVAKLKTHDPDSHPDPAPDSAQTSDMVCDSPEPVVRGEGSFTMYAASLSLDFLWRFIMELGCVDTLLFIELRWVLLHKILHFVSSNTSSCPRSFPVRQQCSGILSPGCSLTSPDLEWVAVTEVKRWCDAAMTCARENTCCSIAAVMQLREDISQWLMALSSTIRSLTLTGPDADSLPHTGSLRPGAVIRQSFEMAALYALKVCLSLYSHQSAADVMGLDTRNLLSFPLHDDISQLVWRESTALHTLHEGGTTNSQIGTIDKELVTDGYAMNSLCCMSGLECAKSAFALLAMCQIDWPLVGGVTGSSLSMRVLVLPTLEVIADAIRKLLLGKEGNGRGGVRAVRRLHRLRRRLDRILALRNPEDG